MGIVLARRRVGGFTLVELLVVIGIISVLIGLLLPSIFKARQQANTAACLSQMREIMLAVTNYTNENKYRLPCPNWGRAFQGWLYDPQVTGQGTYQPSDAESGLLWHYVKTRKVYRCPSDMTDKTSATVENVSSYMMNGAVCGYGNGGSPERITAFKPNSVMCWEIPGAHPNDPGQVNDGADYPGEGICTRHRHGSCIAFIDGHADVMSWNEFTREWFYRYPGILWCAPRLDDGGKSTYKRFPATLPPEPVHVY